MATTDIAPSLPVEVRNLAYAYRAPRRGEEARQALAGVSFSVQPGEMYALLGPNGSGKSTLFRILSTLLPAAEGTAMIFGLDVAREAPAVRSLIGVVFQHPSLDVKLTARENLLHQGHLYGLSGGRLSSAIGEMLGRLGVDGRAHDIVETLSGGLQRRVEIAKALLHRPRLLILDEPSTGLDPGARKEFGTLLRDLARTGGVSVLLTTHLLDEAERCDRIAIMDGGRIVAEGTPDGLKHDIGGDVITVASADPAALAGEIGKKFGEHASVVGGTLRIERRSGHEFIPQLVGAFPGRIDAVTLSKPTLEDVFIDKTGHAFWNGSAQR